MRNLIKFLFFAVIGLISYNYFYGNAEEKARSEKVMDGVKEVFGSIKDLALAEKEKYAEGKYDILLEKIGHVFEDVKEKSADLSEDLKERLASLADEKTELEEQIEAKKKEGLWTKEEQEKTKKEFRELIEKTEDLFKDLEK